MFQFLSKKSFFIIFFIFVIINLIFSLVWLTLGNFFPIEMDLKFNSLKFNVLIIGIIIFSMRCLFLLRLDYKKDQTAILYANQCHNPLRNISNMFTLNFTINYLFTTFNSFNSKKYSPIIIQWSYKIGKYFSNLEKYFWEHVLFKTKKSAIKKSILLAFYQLKLYLIWDLFHYKKNFVLRIVRILFAFYFIPQIILCIVLLYEILLTEKIILTYYISLILIFPLILYCLQKILFKISSYQLARYGNYVTPEIFLYGAIVFPKQDLELRNMMCMNYENYFYAKTLIEIFYYLTDEIAPTKKIIVNMLFLFVVITWVYNYI